MADSVPSEELLIDQGRAYVSMDQIEKWHSDEERKRFMQWIMKKTTTLAAEGMGFFLEDYEEWRGLDKPTQQ